MSEFQREARFFAELPVMPLREVVMLPRTIMPLFVGREASIKAIELAQSGYNKQMFLVAQREPDVEKPGADDLSPVGVVCKVLQMLRLPDGTIKVLFEGLHRARWTELREEDNCLMAMLCTVPESESRPEEREALVRVRQEQQEADPGSAHVHHGPARCRAAGRRRGAPPQGGLPQEAGSAGDRRRHRAPGARVRAFAGRSGPGLGGKAHQEPRQGADGAQPARVLP